MAQNHFPAQIRRNVRYPVVQHLVITIHGFVHELHDREVRRTEKRDLGIRRVFPVKQIHQPRASITSIVESQL